jgi:RHS repeat-associated protein
LGRGSPNPHLGNTVADSDTGLLHVGARYYDPQVGRFISRDAVLSEHPYLYCEHEPVNHVDPSGMFSLHKAIVGALMGIIGGSPGGLRWMVPGAIAGFFGGGYEEGDEVRVWEWAKQQHRDMIRWYAVHPPVSCK